MNSLYKLPLHGVACMPFCERKDHEIVKQLTINFHSLSDGKLIDLKTKSPLWLMSDKGDRYTTEVSLFSTDNKQNHTSNQGYMLQVDCQGKGQFHVAKNNINIYWDTVGTDSAHYFQTIGLALWLELNKILCIHANALAYKDKAIALMAPSRTGKTTLTSYLCKNSFEAMTDDMIAIHSGGDGTYTVYPSWPVVRVWPETLALIPELSSAELGKNKNKKLAQKVHQKFNKQTIQLNSESKLGFCQTAKPLNTIYLLNRIDGLHNKPESSKSCNITPLSSAQAVMLLIQNSIMGSAYKALNIEKQRVKAISELVSGIHFKQVSYVSGEQYLPEIEKEIIKDLEI